MESSNRGKRKSSDNNLNNTTTTETENEMCLDEPAAKLIKINDEEDNVPEIMTCTEENMNIVQESNTTIQEEVLDPVVAEVTEKVENEDGEVVEDAQNTDSLWDIKIQFNNCQIAELYKEKIMKFIQSFVELEIAPDSNDLEVKFKRDPLLDSFEWHVVDESSELQDGEEDSADLSPSKRHKKKKVKKEKPLFVLDTSPMEEDNNKEMHMRYSTKFAISTSVDEEEDSKGGNGCFNCGKNHSLKDCPDPKDYNRINNARSKMKNQRNSSRYHMEDDQRYAHLKPGKISPALRDALGLKRNQLPGFVYTMRVLGYPPGWLEEAKHVNSNLSMFDFEGKDVKKSSLNKKKGLDPDKIVDYPGFNVPMEKGFRDEYRDYQVPPYSDQFSKEAMVKFFAQLQEANKSEDEESIKDTAEEQEEKTDKTENGCEDTEVTEKSEEMIEEPVIENESSLLELEKQKMELLAELNESSNSNSNISSEKKDIVNIEMTNSTEAMIVEENSDLNQSIIKINEVRTTCFGTPILKSSSPYNRLPNPDNFQKDVSPVINFENLPNSTGKYEQMTEVLQKVRTKLKDLQSTS